MSILPRAQSPFQTVREIPLPDVARRYGLELRRSGSRYVTRCPFHDDRNPSFYVFPDNRWRCFGCGAYGDAVDLVARLLGLRPLEAARRICLDFGLPVDRPLPPEARQKERELARERELERVFREWCKATYLRLCLVYRAIGQVLTRGPTSPAFAAACHLEPYIEYLLDILQFGSDQQKLELFADGSWDLWLS
ncbi:MAG: CHC2 zinc finger domain-containing protein [Desulfofundulus sp.]